MCDTECPRVVIVYLLYKGAKTVYLVWGGIRQFQFLLNIYLVIFR